MKLNKAKNVSQWLRAFATDALADDCAEIKRHIEYLKLDCAPEEFVYGTTLLLLAVTSYRKIDGRESASLWRQQHYRLGGEGLPFYCLTFELGVGHFGRILTNNKLSEVDFADLFDNPWDEYEQGGFNRVWISRLDGKPIGDKECKALYKLVTDDMYFDHPEEEVVVNVDKTELADTVIVTAFEI